MNRVEPSSFQQTLWQTLKLSLSRAMEASRAASCYAAVSE